MSGDSAGALLLMLLLTMVGLAAHACSMQVIIP